MELYLATDSSGIHRAITYTAHLCHMNYRIGPDGLLFSSPLPEKLRGGLLMLSDEGGQYPEDPASVCRQLVQECICRNYTGVVLDALPPENFCRQLDELLNRHNRQLFLPEKVADYAPHGAVLLCTALTGGSLEDRLQDAAAHWGANRLALDLQRMMLDFPLTAPSGSGTPLSPQELHALAAGRSTYFSRPLCARYFTYRRDNASRFVLFDDVQTLRSKMDTAEALGIRWGFFMLPEVEDLADALFAGEK